MWGNTFAECFFDLMFVTCEEIDLFSDIDEEVIVVMPFKGV